MKAMAISTIRTTPADSGTERNRPSGISGSLTFVSQKAKSDEARRRTPTEEGPGRAVAPAPGRGLDERPDQAEHRAGQQHDAEDVEGARGVLGAVVEQDQQAEDEGEDADRHVDEEDRLPADVLDEHAAEDRAAGGGGADDHAPDADRHVQLLGREGGAQQAERGRHQQGAEQALEAPGRRRPAAMLSERPMAPEAAAKPTTPIRKVWRWPKRSPSLPAVIRATARARK